MDNLHQLKNIKSLTKTERERVAKLFDWVINGCASKCEGCNEDCPALQWYKETNTLRLKLEIHNND